MGSPATAGHPRSRWLLVLLLLVVVLLAARVAHSRHTASVPLPPSTAQVVLVGFTAEQGRPSPVQSVTDGPGRFTQRGALSLGTGPSSSCAVAAWATIGAGHSVPASTTCVPTTQHGRSVQWSAALVAGAGQGASLGALAASTAGCVAAVGPGAALGAARPDGSVEHFETLPHFLADGGSTPCTVTLVDAGADPGAVVRLLAGRPDLTVIVAAIASVPTAHPVGVMPVVQVAYAPSGWLTSASTRRPGIVTLPDLHATLAQFGGGRRAGLPSGDGSPFRLRTVPLGASGERDLLAELAAVPAGLAVGERITVALAALALVCTAAGWVARRVRWVRAATGALLVLPAAAALTGAVPWSRTPWPGLALGVVLLSAGAVLGVVAQLVKRRWGTPIPVVTAGLLLLVLTLDAATGGMGQEASLLNPRPLDGGRWYGFGNLTFAFYACAALVLVGHLLRRVQQTGHGTVLVVVVGVTLVALDGWPGAGADLGGALTLALTMGWLLLGLSRRATRGFRPLLAVIGACVTAGGLAWLDWLRGPSRRTHLGAFVQRVLDADAGTLLVRKAHAVAASLAGPWGLVALGAGGLVWLLVVRARRRVAPVWPDFDRLLVSVLAAASLGTVLNDSGVVVWAAVTSAFGVTVLALVTETDWWAARSAGWRRRRPTGLLARDPARRTTPVPGRA